MGNAEYDILRIPPNGYVTNIGAGDGANLGPVGLTYDTVKQRRPAQPDRHASGSTRSTPTPSTIPKTYSTSLSVARRIPWQQVLEVGYVGTFGRHLLNRRQDNVIQPGTFLQGTSGQLRSLEPAAPRRR